MTGLPYICNNTTIYQLMQAGIVPNWMYRDCDVHGMDTAEDFLCEWDWEWDWDLGYGYSDAQLAILKQARETVKQGIEEYLRNPELQKQEKAKFDARKRAKALETELSKKFRPIFYAGEVPEAVRFVMEHGEEPLFLLFHRWFKRYRHTDRAKIRFFMAGVYDGECHTPKETLELQTSGELKEKYGIETDFSLASLRRYASKPYEITGKLSYLIPSIKEKLEEYLQSYSEGVPFYEVWSRIDASHPVWEDIKQREGFEFDHEVMLRALRYFI